MAQSTPCQWAATREPIAVAATCLALLLSAACTTSPDETTEMPVVTEIDAGSVDDGSISPLEVTSLFNGIDLAGWHADVPDADGDSDLLESFVVRDGYLVSLGEPRGHLITNASYKNYRLEVEYRFPGEGGNCGILVHAGRPRALYEMFPQSIEVQMSAGDAGDFWCIEEDLQVPDMETRRPRREGQQWGGSEGDARRILNLTDDSEHALGQWNSMVIEAVGDTITVWVNGTLVNRGAGATVTSGQIAVQAEGAVVELRKIEIGPPSKSR